MIRRNYEVEEVERAYRRGCHQTAYAILQMLERGGGPPGAVQRFAEILRGYRYESPQTRRPLLLDQAERDEWRTWNPS